MLLSRSKRLGKFASIVGAAALIAIGAGTAYGQSTCSGSPCTTNNGTWTLYPSPYSYMTQVLAPLAADGSSTFSVKRGVIPVQFSLTAGTNVVFQSIGSNTSTADDASSLTYVPKAPLTFSQLSSLKANYTFTTGDCHGGSLRWSIVTPMGNAFIYYGLPPEAGNGGTGGCTPTSAGGQDQSGTEMIANSVIQYDTSQIKGGTYFSNYSDALKLLGSATVSQVILVLDSGWQQCSTAGASGCGDQILTLGNVTVNSDTFLPPATSAPAGVCTLPSAQISVSLLPTNNSNGSTVTPTSVSNADTTGYFRTADCHYMYNLDVSSLPGAGTYSVGAVINGGSQASGAAQFKLQ